MHPHAHDGEPAGMNSIGPEILILIVPAIAVELALLIAALYDLTRPGRRVRGDSRGMWALIIILINLVGPILYFLVGRMEASSAEVDALARPPAPPAPGARPGWISPDAAAPAPAPAPTTAPTPAPAESPARPAAATASVAAPAPPTAVRAPSDAPPAIRARGLTKRYGSGTDSVLALDQLDLEVPTGSVFGLLGPNGAGKTTTLRLLTGLARPTAGAATIAGIGLDGDGVALRDRIGYLDQEPRYYGWATARELVTMVGRLYGMDGGGLRERVGEVLEQVGLAAAADRRVGGFSGGMRQRLGIAQALVNRPAVVILDEPVSSLDPEGRRDLLGLIAALRGTSTVLFSTHVLSDIERICDRVGILDHGRLVTEAPLGELLDRYALPVYRLDPEAGQDEAIERLLAALRGADWMGEVVREHGYVRITVHDPARASAELLPAVVAAGIRLESFERVRPTLEDVFLQLVGRDAGPDGRGAAA